MSSDNNTQVSAQSLAASVRSVAQKGPPPVDKWNPPYCGALDIRIARDGTWYYLGTPFTRPELVRLFASIIRKDGDDYFLVTPFEKVGITVDDAPFVAVDFDVTDQGLSFVTNVGDRVTLDPDHPLRVTFSHTGEPAPYILIRRNLEALIDRKSFYRLVDLCDHRDGMFGLQSGETFFPIMPSKDLG